MNALRKYFGILWIILALVIAYYGLAHFGIPKLKAGKQEDLVFGIIIIFILLPIVCGGLIVFGRYAFAGLYGISPKASERGE